MTSCNVGTLNVPSETVPGTFTCDHADPFQWTTRPAVVPPYPSLPRLPIAHTSVADAPSTSVRKFWVGSGLGLGTIDQPVPFHCWISVRTLGAADVENVPTAHAFVVEKVLTPDSELLDEAGGAGLATSLQELPFQRSVSEPKVTTPPPSGTSFVPTAKTLVDALPSTPLSWPPSVGVLTIVHACRSTARRAAGRTVAEVSGPPGRPSTRRWC
jgi:hypothetical protein